VLQTSVYLWLNQHPQRTPSQFPLTWLDRAIPFWPWTIWPYLGMLVIQAVLPLVIRQGAVLRCALAAYLPAMTVTFLIHGLWPVAYSALPSVEDDTATGWLYCWLGALQTPASAFPSGHIVGPVVMSWGVWLDRRGWWPWLLVYLALGSPTILTTKQHYVWDLVGGVGIAVICILAASWLLPARNVAESLPASPRSSRSDGQNHHRCLP
jgi:hypothetical protein